MLCDRFRDEGLRLDSAGNNLASAEGPSSLTVVRRFTSWSDPWEGISKSGSPGSNRKSRRPRSLDGTGAGTGELLPINDVSESEEPGTKKGLSAFPGCGYAALN
jgi:hypothetical protein